MAEPSTETSPPPRPKEKFIDGGVLFLFAFVLVAGAACYFFKGPAVFWQTLEENLWLLALLIPVVTGGLVLAACMQVLIPPEFIRRTMGDGSGFRGIVVASIIGLLVPGGPMISLPLISSMIAVGASEMAAVAYVTSWSVLPLNRIIQWQLPLMGVEFTVIQYLASLPLPILAAYLAAPLLRRFTKPKEESGE
jgi:uncharacterized membrane protein YraQ (UPF0718 family)